MQPIVLSELEAVIPRGDLIFCLCPVCCNEVNWRHFDATLILHGSCCCHSFRAFPARPDLSMYRVQTKPANMDNVFWLYRKSRIETTPPPKYA